MRALLLVLAVLGAAGCEQAHAQDLGDDSMMRGGMSGKGSMQMPGGPRAFVESDLYARDFRLNQTAASTSSLPTCTVGVGCELQCRCVADAWACVDEAGASVAVTAGSGVIGMDTIWGRCALDEITDARAPALTSAFDAVFAGAHTVLITGYSTTHNDATYQIVFTNNPGAGSATIIREEGTTGRTLAGTYTAIGGAGASFKLGWNMTASVSSAANDAFTFNTGGVTGSSGAGAYTDPTTTVVQFGRRAAGGLAMYGPLESVTIYSDDKTADEIEAMLHTWAGIPADASSPVLHSRPGQQFVIDGDGRAQPLGWNVPHVSSGGIELQPNSSGPTNAPAGSGWATDATDVDSWTDVGTPTITANQAAGPFAAWRVGPGSNEADLVVDNDAAAKEGLQGVLGCGDAQNVTGDYTASCYVRSGTSGTTTTEVTIAVQTDGTGSLECEFTDLTTSFVRKECYAAITGSPTSIKGRVLVGDDAADTGSVIVSQCQCENRGYATAPKPNNEATADDVWTIPETETDTWPSGETVGADIEIVFQVDFEHPTEAFDYLMLHDTINDAGDDHADFLGVEYVTKATSPVRARVALRPQNETLAGDGSDTDTFADLPGVVEAGQWYVMRFRYTPMGEVGGIPRVAHYIYWDECADPATCTATTLIGSDTTGNKYAQDDTRDIAYFGRRYDLNRGFAGRIARFTVTSLTP